MADKQRTYFCIDMKSFYASVECAERGLNPFETNLVVADESRGKGALCLAITPRMKSLGAKNRCRLFEIPRGMNYQVAMPRMKKYIEYAADIYDIYLQYIAKEDIHVYSIDESFIDATDYLKCYKLTAKEFASQLMNEVALKKHIPATAGIGTNLYLAKIALDITAKNVPDHMGYLNEELYRQTLWDHQPITDFWQIARGTAARLSRVGIKTMRGITKASEDWMYKTFGINAEILIDHAWGRESCTMEEIESYKSKSKSVSSSQILFSDYSFEKAALVVDEMTLQGCQELMRRHQVTNKVGIFVGYTGEQIPPTGGTVKMYETTNLYSIISKYVRDIFNKTTNKKVGIRRIGIDFPNVSDASSEGYNLFTDMEAVEKEKKSEAVVLELKDRYGKNAVLRASDLQEGATTIIRNKLIGGHNSE